MIFNKNKFSIVSPIIMGICNVTKDSFSDGGKNYKTSNALKSIKSMIEEGAQIIDIGAESTKPGSDPISYKEEIKKLSPILKKLPKDQFLISIDSSKIETQEFALENGAHIINDVFGGSKDLFQLTKKFKNGLVLMHTPAPPKIMQSKVYSYKNVVSEYFIFINFFKSCLKNFFNITDNIFIGIYFRLHNFW
jgi:dihydropteroate synthase